MTDPHRPERPSSTAPGAWDEFWSGKDLVVIDADEKHWRSVMWHRAFRFWEERFAAAPGRRFVECGAGSAQTSLYLAGRGFDCTMLDNSAPGAEMGRRNFRSTGLEGKFLVGDMCSLPFDDRSFDVVFSDGVLEHFESIEQPIKEMVRILRPGGIFAAEVVPRKISCQTLGNIEIFCARLAKRILSLQLRRAVSDSRSAWDIYENSIRPGEYVQLLHQEGVDNAVARASSPFPDLSLPESVARLYGRIMLGSKRLWDRFERSPSRLALAWSSTFRVYGTKSL